MNELEKIEKRIAGREAAHAAIQLAIEDLTDTEFRRGVAKYCREFADVTLGPTESPLLTMTEDEANRYEMTLMTFGKHQGLRIRDAPIAYLSWLADNTLKLQSYLRSDIGQDRINVEPP